MMVGERVAVTVDATAHVKKGAVKIAKDVMVPGPSPVMQPVTEPVKEAATVDVADGVVAAAGVAPGVIAEIVLHQARHKALVKHPASASALMQKANPSHWTRLPHLA